MIDEPEQALTAQNRANPGRAGQKLLFPRIEEITVHVERASHESKIEASLALG
jgi:hypothetical protein